MSKTELVGVIFGLVSVVLTVKKSIWCWPTGIISVAAFTLLFWSVKLYADMGLQVFFLITSLYGWWAWLYGGPGHTELKVGILSWRARLGVVAGIGVTVVCLGELLHRYTDASVPFWDSLASSMSVIAQLLLMRKVFENWVLWILVDVLSIGIYFYKQVYFTAGLYCVFLILAILGFRLWLADVKKVRL